MNEWMRWTRFVCFQYVIAPNNRSYAAVLHLFNYFHYCSVKIQVLHLISFQRSPNCVLVLFFLGTNSDSSIRKYIVSLERIFFLHFFSRLMSLMMIGLDCLTRRWETIKWICAYIMQNKNCFLVLFFILFDGFFARACVCTFFVGWIATLLNSLSIYTLCFCSWPILIRMDTWKRDTLFKSWTGFAWNGCERVHFICKLWMNRSSFAVYVCAPNDARLPMPKLSSSNFGLIWWNTSMDAAKKKKRNSTRKQSKW